MANNISDRIAILACVEKVLLERGPEYDQVLTRLNAKYETSLIDCCERSEYLRDILDEVFGDGTCAVIEQICHCLKNFTENQTISNFLEKLKR
ncbi:MAG: hypothetical protein COW27_04370 [Nitrosopumilales archaeon CG15_BIG_FIL_POST_REV_8_21_14_020_37_12]|nr:MAG: hypothetical protein COW27_04370 [Nitrosopumilales archaeon CG15_BIG_FIL_POST_REV_8_21_14_020_37_12]